VFKFPYGLPFFHLLPHTEMSRTLVDYGDLAFESPPVSPRTVDANMSYNLAMVKSENHLWEIDLDSPDTGLWRQNAMTTYEPMTPYLVLARDFTTQEKLYFLVKVKEHPNGWVKVSVNEGNNIYNINQN